MLKNWALALFNVLCIVLIVTSAITVSAVGENDGVTSQESVEVSSINEQSSYSVDDEFSLVNSSSESESFSSDSSVSDNTDSSDLLESDTSSTVETSSDESSSDSTSSKNTSSKKPIHSTGGHGGTFIEQDVTSSRQSVTTSSTVSTTSTESLESYVEDEDEDVDHYVAHSKSAANAVLKLIWIPIVLIVLCTGGLITANVMFRRKYPKKADDGAVRRSKNARGAVRRRK